MENKEIKKTRFCLGCKRFFGCKGCVDVTTCVNYIPRKEDDNGNNKSNDKED